MGKVLLEFILKLLNIKRVYASNGGFFDDYPSMSGRQFIIKDAVEQASNVFGFGFEVIKWVWVFMFFFTCIVVIISWVRMAILADDIPQKKMVAKHDLAGSLVALAIMGSMPLVFGIIMALLNMSF